MVESLKIARAIFLATVGSVVWYVGGIGAVAPVYAQDEPGNSGAAAQESGESGEQPAETEKSDKEGDDASESEEGSDSKSESAGSLPEGAPMPEDVGEARRREIEEFRSVYERYANEIQDYRDTVDSIVDAAYTRRRKKLNKRFDVRGERLQEDERQRRNRAIEKFERFLKRHPDHPRYSPDAMFRLAELYFEQENDEYLQADQRYQNEMERYREGRRPSRPEAPRKDYGDTIDTFSRLVEQWPGYRLLDGAYYLLAYCQEQMGNARKARDLFAELVVKRPNSEFVPEAWVRIGEYHFDRSDDIEEIEAARGAYRQAMKYRESRFYDKALYKLAWSEYRLDNFAEAIEQFKRLVEYSDRQKAETGQSGSVLRAEAIQYIAVSLAEEDWDLDRQVDDAFGLERVKKYLGGDKAYQREVLVELVDYLFENTRYEVARKVIRYGLEKYPMHPDNPELHEKLIVALMRPPKKLEQAFEERGLLPDEYGPESEWYAHQKREGNEDAVDYGDKVIRENLIQAATWFHEQAQKLKDKAQVKQDKKLLKRARNRYEKAADAYERFLKRYPNDKDIYRWNFYYAEALYYSGQYQRAYEQYRVVRELDVSDNKYQGDAGFNAVKALEFQIESRVKKGDLPSFVAPGTSQEEARETARKQEKRKDQQKSEEEEQQQEGPVEIESKPIPEMVRKYITSMDRFVILGLDYGDNKEVAPKFAFNAAKLFYDFKHYDTARERFAWIVDKYPDREEAFLGGSLILEMYRQEKKYDKLAKWAEKLSGVLTGEQAKAVKKEVREFKLGAKFKEAEKLFSEEKYDKAAKKYEELVDEAPDHENAPRALNNAAVAYEKLKKFDSATKLYQRVYREYPKSPLSAYALYRVGVNSERFFDFDKAVSTYMLFYEEYEGKTPKELQGMGFVIEDKRPKALLSAAVLSENLQKYEKAASLYEQFVETYPNNDEAPTAQWQAVQSWEKAGQKDKMVDAIETYEREFGSNPDRAARVLEGKMKIAKYREEQGRTEDKFEIYEEIIKTFKERELEPGSDAAYYAAKSKFHLAERRYQEWKEIEIDGSLENQSKMLEKKKGQRSEVAKGFRKVWEYQNLEYTLAAGFRMGSLYQHFAEALYDVPVPFEPGSEKFMMYRNKLDKIARPLEDKAVKRYKKTIQKAREQKIVNEWTKKTLDELNKYRPQEFPLYKESRSARKMDLSTGRAILDELREPSGESELGSGEGGGGSEEETGSEESEGSGENTDGDQSGEQGGDESSSEAEDGGDESGESANETSSKAEDEATSGQGEDSS